MQETAFRTAIPRRNSRVGLDLLPKHGPSVLDNPKKGISRADYYPIAQLSGETLSPAMLEYVNTPTFDRTIEQKKHKQLKRYFHEKYRLFSRLLSEDILAEAFQDTAEGQGQPSETNKGMDISGDAANSAIGLGFQQGMSRVNAEVEAIVEAKFQLIKAENDKRKRLELAKQRFSEKARKATNPPASLSSFTHFSTKLQSPKTEMHTFSLERETEIPKLPLLVGHHSPTAVIRENQAISKALGRHFLRNLPKGRRTKSTTSFFLT